MDIRYWLGSKNPSDVGTSVFGVCCTRCCALALGYDGLSLRIGSLRRLLEKNRHNYVQPHPEAVRLSGTYGLILRGMEPGVAPDIFTPANPGQGIYLLHGDGTFQAIGSGNPIASEVEVLLAEQHDSVA